MSSRSRFTDGTIIPVVMYDPNTPPFIPKVKCSKALSFILPLVCSEVCNTAGLRVSDNTARTYCYNVLADNYWQNQEYAQVVQYVIGYIEAKYAKGELANPSVAIHDATDFILKLYTSSLCVTDRELKAVLEPKLLHIANQNIAIWSKVKDEIFNFLPKEEDSMYPQNNVGFQQPSMYPQQGGFPAQQQGMYQQPGMYPQQPMMQPGMYQQPIYHQPMQSNIGFQNQQGFHNQPTNSFVNANNQPQVHQQDLRQGRFLRNDSQTVQQVQELPQQFQQQPAQVTKTSVQENPTEECNIVKYTDDSVLGLFSENHGIKMFDHTFVVDGVINNEISKYTNCSKLYIYNKLVIRDTLLGCLIDVKVDYLEEGVWDLSKTDSFTFFNTECMVYNTVYSKAEIDEYVYKIISQPTVEEMSITGQSIIHALKTDEVGNANEIAALKEVDAFLIRHYNNIIKYQIPEDIIGDSFFEDAGKMENYVARNYSETRAGAIRAANNLFVKSINNFIGISDSIKECVHSAIDTTVNYSFIPMFYNITHTVFTEKDLGITVDSEPKVITVKETPYLHQIVNSILKKRSVNNITFMYHILVTSDNVIYYMYECISRPGVLMIRRV